MSIARLTEQIEILVKNGMLPNSAGISTINIVDFYARLGYIWRLAGATGGALKISFVTPDYTNGVRRIPLSDVYYDGVTNLTIYEGGSATTGGDVKTPLNADRTALYTSGATIKTGVTYADDGTILASWSGSKQKSPDLELWYLKSSTQYVFVFSASTNYRIQWAELA